jgi:hypothetical protein
MAIMYTVAETELFQDRAAAIWSEDERLEFCTWLASNPEAGDVVPGSGGCRKVRWSMGNIGKRGGVRIIYYNELEDGVIWLLTIYAKAQKGNIPADILKRIRELL